MHVCMYVCMYGPAEALTPGRVSLAPLAMSSAKFLFRRYEHPILPFPHSPSLHLTHLTHPRVGFPSLFVPGAAAVKPPGLKRLRTQAIYSFLGWGGSRGGRMHTSV